MANKYWVSAGNSTWATAANWRTSSGGTTTTTVPTAADNVFFDANSGTSTVTIGAAATCLDLNCTNWGGTMAGSSNLNIYGSFFTGGSWTYTGGVQFLSSGTGNTIDVGTGTGNNIGLGRSNITFANVNGEWSLTSGLPVNSAVATTRLLILTSGTIIAPTGSYYIECGTFSSSNTNTRTITAPNSVLIRVFGTTGTVVNISTATNFTLGTNVTFSIDNYAGTLNTNTKTVSLGAFSAANAPNISYESCGGTLSLTGNVNSLSLYQGFGGLGTIANNALTIYGDLVSVQASTFTFTGGANAWTFASTGTTSADFGGSTLDFPIIVNGGGTYSMSGFTQGSTRTFTFSAGTISLYGTVTVGSFVTSGTTLKYLNSTVPGTQATISQASGTVTATYLSVKDSNATGGATWNGSSLTNVNLGNNTGWTLPPVASSGSANFFMIF